MRTFLFAIALAVASAAHAQDRVEVTIPGPPDAAFQRVKAALVLSGVNLDKADPVGGILVSAPVPSGGAFFGKVTTYRVALLGTDTVRVVLSGTTRDAPGSMKDGGGIVEEGPVTKRDKAAWAKLQALGEAITKP